LKRSINISNSECEINFKNIEDWLKIGYTEVAFEEIKKGLECKKGKELDLAVFCDKVSSLYTNIAATHSDKRDWLLAGQILFDTGRTEILCGRLDKAYRFLLEAGENYSNSPRLYRYAASAYISGIAIAKKYVGTEQLYKYVEKAQWWLDWEAERYRLSRDNELLAQTYDDKFILDFILGHYKEAVSNLENSARLYEKLSNPLYKTIAAFRYSLIASIQRGLTEELGWSKFNRLASQAFTKGGDNVAASIEALKLNLYISTDKTTIENIVDVANKISESVSSNAAFSLLLTVFVSTLDSTINEPLAKMHEFLVKMSESSNDVKLTEFIKLVLASSFEYHIEIEHLGRYKLVGDRWVRI